jgi:hypothetical protein
MFIIVSKYLIPKAFNAIALYPFIFLKHENDKKDEVLINHERIHLRQQIELLIVLFYLWYLAEFLLRWIQYKQFMIAYRNISFEREAYRNEKKLDYIEKKALWSFLKFV